MLRFGKPEHGNAKPEHGNAKLGLRFAKPEHGNTKLGLGFAKPEHGNAKPELGFAKPEHGNAKPGPRFAKPKAGNGKPGFRFAVPGLRFGCRWFRLGFQHHLHAVVFLVAEDVVAVGGFAQGQVVGDDVVELHLAVDDVLQELVDVPLGGGLAAHDLDALVEELPEGKVVERGDVHAQHRDGAAAAHGAHAGLDDFGRAFFQV